MTFTIRPSSLPTWPDCNRRGAARLAPKLLAAQGFKTRQSVAPAGAVIGTATHSAVAHTMRHKVETGECANGTETEQIGLESLTAEVGKGVRWDGISPNLNTAQKQVIRQYKSYRIHLADRIAPRIVEHRIEVETQMGNVLSGSPDLCDDGVHDLKTGVQQRINIAQYGAYAALEESQGHKVEHITEDYVKRVSIDKEQPAPVQIGYDLHFAKKVAGSIILDIEDKMARWGEGGDPIQIFIANPSSQLCSSRYCACFHSAWCPESFGKADSA